MVHETEEVQTDLELFKRAVNHKDSTLIEELLYNGYKPDYTTISFSDELLPTYSICYVRPENLDVLAKYNAFPFGVSLATVKFVAFAHGNRNIVWEDFWDKPNLNLNGIDGYRHPALALATYGYSRYYGTNIHPQKRHFELLAIKGALWRDVSLATLLYVAYANGNDEIKWEDFINEAYLNLEGIPGIPSPMYLLARSGRIAEVDALIKLGLKHRPLEFLDDDRSAYTYFSHDPCKELNGHVLSYKERILDIIYARLPYVYLENYPKTFEIAEMFLQNPTPDLQISLRKFCDKISAEIRAVNNSKRIKCSFPESLWGMLKNTVELKSPRFTAFFAWLAQNNKAYIFNSQFFLQMFNSDVWAARESVLVATAFVRREFLAIAIQQPAIDSATIVEACNIAAITGDNQTLQILLPLFRAEAIKTHIPAYVLVHRNLGNPLFAAILNKHRGTVQLLIDSGVITSSISDTVFKSSCLQWAVNDGDIEIIAILLKADDINLNQQDSDGNSALHVAAEKGYENVIMKLIDAGADRNLRNSKGETALDLINDPLLRGNMAVYKTEVSESDSEEYRSESGAYETEDDVVEPALKKCRIM